MSWDPGPSSVEVCADNTAALIEKVDAMNARLDKIIALLKLMYEARP